MMRTAVSDSSIRVFNGEIAGEVADGQAERLYRVIERFGRCTRRQIAKELKMETGTTSRAVDKLLTKEYPARVKEELSLFPCPITGRRVHFVYAISGTQMRLI